MGKITTLLTLIFFSGMLLGACQAPKKATERLLYQQLEFGSGGGFTGGVTTYTLHQNGEIASTNSLTKESKLEKKLSPEETNEIFKKAEALNLENIDFTHPGNMYYFIQTTREASTHRITWGSNDHEAPQAVLDFYQLLESKIADQ